jgi:CUE domain-containing protein
MSETASRPLPSRGRGSTRGSRGGFRRTGGRDRLGPGDHRDSHNDETEQGEIGEMKKKYPQELSSLKEMFPEWADVDLLFALEETDGDVFRTVEHISAGIKNTPISLSLRLIFPGNASQFSDVKKKTKDRSRSKAKDSAPTEAATRAPRARTGGVDAARGRGRGDRGRSARPSRGAPSAETRNANASAPNTTVSTTDSTAWDTNDSVDDSATNKPVTTPTAAPPAAQSGPPKKTWASMFAPQPKPIPVAQPKPVVETSPVPDTGAVPSSDISSGYVEVTHSDIDEPAQPTPHDDLPPAGLSNGPAIPDVVVDESHVDIPPSKDRLTEDNVEHLPDSSGPPPTGTAASTVESSRGPDSTVPTAQGIAQAPIARPAMGGYATTAYKATAPQGRSASFQRRLMEQQEAVVMPGNHAVDRAAVQFGSLGLNGESSTNDVDEDREDAETRAQPPQHSPTAQPRASLPPAPRSEPVTQDHLSGPKPAPGLAPVAQKDAFSQSSAQIPTGPQSMGQQSGQGYNHFSRYGQSAIPSEASSTQKPFDPFGQQPAAQNTSESYSAHPQTGAQSQQAQSQLGGLSSNTNDYGSYGSYDQRNAAYSNYYGGFGQQNANTQQDGAAAQQRNGSGFGAGSNENAFPASQTQVSSYAIATQLFANESQQQQQQQQQQQSRFADNQHSGHNTPNPTAPGQQHSTQHMHQQPPGQGHQGAFYGGHPYYNAPYYQAYMNQYGYGQQGFGGQFGKGQMYGQPHHGYGMPQSTYDQHSSAPAVSGGFGGESNLRGGLSSEYSRSGSAQPSQSQASTSGFGNMGDVFGRSPGSFPSQAQQYGQQASSQQGGADESLKPLVDKSTGPSSGSLGQPGRPSSTTNQANQSGLPPPQSHQGFGGYPGHLGQQANSQYGLGNLGGQHGAQQSHQGSGGYGGYGAGFGGNYSQSYGGRGWGGNYSHQ